jgi:hypothetical protein
MTNQIQQDFRLSPYWVDGMNIPSFDWEKFQNQIDSLNENLYTLLTSNEAVILIKGFVSQYNFSLMQGSEIARVLRDTILSNIFIGDMPLEISKRLNIDLGVATGIANQIVSQIFAPALDDIKKLQAVKFPGRVGQPQQTQQPTPQPLSVPRQFQGANLPETGGNIIDLRNQK